MAARSAPFAGMRTSELLRRAAALLEAGALTVDHQMAAELRVRARWIEIARHDTGVSQDRRLAVAAIEDAPVDLDRTVVVSVEVFGGWWFAVWRRSAGGHVLFDVALARPSSRRDRPCWEAKLRASTDEAIESAAGFLGRELNIPSARVAETLAAALDIASS